MRFDIAYRMAFDYPEPVWESQNEIRVRPRDDERQRVLSYRLSTRPAGRVLSFHDYWGTTVDQVGVRHRHDRFEIVAEAAVETFPPATTADGELRGRDGGGVGVGVGGGRRESGARPHPALSAPVEHLQPTAHTAWDAALADLALAHAPATLDPVDRILAVSALVHSLLDYRPGTTDIGVTPSELVAGGSGVCQDFAHLAIALLRSLAVPARYVSGYLFAADETSLDDSSEAVVAVQTHAWIEAAIADGSWLAVDPTNQSAVGERHVAIGHGRDYDDVPPVRGVFTGPASPTVDSQVTITRLSPLVRTVTSDFGRPRLRPVTDPASRQQ